jgi:hypothetical protein
MKSNSGTHLALEGPGRPRFIQEQIHPDLCDKCGYGLQIGHHCEATKVSGISFSGYGSKSNSRKAASAQIAKIPFPLARYIAQAFKC